jgi:FkbM family methyltransferase
VARYDVAPAWFRTPGGRSALVYVREGTNDWNTANSCLTEDEYGTAGLTFSGDFLDIGGYLGTVSLAVLLDHPDTRAIIVEPLPENIDRIVQNLAVNGLTARARVVAGLVGFGETTVNYAFRDDENALHHAFVGNSGLITDQNRPHRSVTYSASRYRDLAPDGVAFCKIDCEGGEWGFFEDPDVQTIPLIVGEIHPVSLPDGTTGSRARLERLLPTHDITYPGPEATDWGFRAVRR